MISWLAAATPLYWCWRISGPQACRRNWRASKRSSGKTAWQRPSAPPFCPTTEKMPTPFWPRRTELPRRYSGVSSRLGYCDVNIIRSYMKYFFALVVSCAPLLAQPGIGRDYGRSMTISQQGIAATSQILASEAAAQMSAEGGSAADAAIAANAVLG